MLFACSSAGQPFIPFQLQHRLLFVISSPGHGLWRCIARTCRECGSRVPTQHVAKAICFDYSSRMSGSTELKRELAELSPTGEAACCAAFDSWPSVDNGVKCSWTANLEKLRGVLGLNQHVVFQGCNGKISLLVRTAFNSDLMSCGGHLRA